MNEYHYEYIWNGITKHFYASSRVNADRQFLDLMGFAPDPTFVRVVRHNS